MSKKSAVKQVETSTDSRVPPAPKMVSPETNRDSQDDVDTTGEPIEINETDTDDATIESTEAKRDLDQIAHEMAQCQKDLDALENEKALVGKDYGRRLNTLGSRVSELAAEYCDAEQRVEYDYENGVAMIYSRRTGDLLETRPLAPSERQIELDLPMNPPADVSTSDDEDLPL